MNIHIVWTQGWDNAPPQALQNAEAWAAVGNVRRWCLKTAAEQGFVPPDVIGKAKFPAMQADLILAAAMLTEGGFAAGADMCPVQPAELKEALERSEAHNLGMVVYQSYKDEPYSGASYFPAGHAWLRLVQQRQWENVALRGDERRVSMVTGPYMWRQLIRRNAGLWLSSVRTVPAWIAFTHEPKTRGTWRKAWINPGLNGDWLGTKPEKWR